MKHKTPGVGVVNKLVTGVNQLTENQVNCVTGADTDGATSNLSDGSSKLKWVAGAKH